MGVLLRNTMGGQTTKGYYCEGKEAMKQRRNEVKRQQNVVDVIDLPPPPPFS